MCTGYGGGHGEGRCEGKPRRDISRTAVGLPRSPVAPGGSAGGPGAHAGLQAAAGKQRGQAAAAAALQKKPGQSPGLLLVIKSQMNYSVP